MMAENSASILLKTSAVAVLMNESGSSAMRSWTLNRFMYECSAIGTFASHAVQIFMLLPVNRVWRADERML